MNKKSVAASILVVFLAVLFSVVGVCFSYFVFTDTKIEVKKVLISTAQGIDVFEDENLTKRTTNLKLSNMDLGIKPATGEIDSETQVPSTITDTGTSEGYYASVYVKTTLDFKVVVKNISIESKKNKLDVKEERKNIFVSIKDVKNSTKSLENDEIELVELKDVSGVQKLTFFIWMGALAGELLEGAKISFSLDFVAV